MIATAFTTVVVIVLAVAFWPAEGITRAAIRGTVTNGEAPVPGAIVRVRATTAYTLTDNAGHFELNGLDVAQPVEVTAWAPGYYITGTSDLILPGGEPIALALHRHPTEDNPDYRFISPTLDLENDSACVHCHARHDDTLPYPLPVEEWLLDAHSGSATNPRFLSLYNGDTVNGDPGALTAYRYDPALAVNLPVSPSMGMDASGPGFRLDYPDQAGFCAPCHVPVAALDSPFNADPNLADGVALEGATCDFCHKIWDVRLEANGLPSPSLPGTLSLEMLRPEESHQVFVGQYDDVNGEDIFSPLIDQSAFCAACHFGEFWGVTMYNSFGEWLESPFSDPETGQTCQDCHMPRTGTTAFAQLPEDSDMLPPPPRDPDTIFGHLMPGAADLDLLANTATLDIETTLDQDRLTVTVRVTNFGAGHHIPTDNPLRNMILLLTVTDSDGQPLTQLAGPIIPDWGGIGDPVNGYYAGLPGVLYAKILSDFYTGETPTFAYWRQTRLVSDNRIPALETDESHYTFELPDDAGPITVDAQLLLRRAFIELMAVKGWQTPDLLMEHETVIVE